MGLWMVTGAGATSIGFADASQLARNLVVTPSDRLSLFDVDAAYHSYPPSDYVGLAKGDHLLRLRRAKSALLRGGGLGAELQVARSTSERSKCEDPPN
jgi:hypothetical protein